MKKYKVVLSYEVQKTFIVNAKNEDDGYLISFLTDNETGNSEAVIFDARKISAGPICRLKIPERVPVGFHACWVSSDKAVGL